MRGVLLSSSRPWYCSTPFHVDLAFLRSLDGGAGPTVTGDVAPGDVTRKLVFALPSVAGDVLSAPRLLPGEQAALSRFEAPPQRALLSRFEVRPRGLLASRIEAGWLWLSPRMDAPQRFERTESELLPKKSD